MSLRGATTTPSAQFGFGSLTGGDLGGIGAPGVGAWGSGGMGDTGEHATGTVGQPGRLTAWRPLGLLVNSNPGHQQPAA